MIRIVCKIGEAEKLNSITKLELGIFNEDEYLWFWTEKEYMDWAKEINADKKHPNRCLKPKDRDIAAGELKITFPYYPVNSADLDPKYGRCPDEYLMKTLGFLIAHKDQLNWVNIEDLYGRDLDEEKISNTKEILKKAGVGLDDPNIEPVVLNPDWGKEKETMPETGIVECRSWSQDNDRRSWILFGNIDSPAWMHERKYLSGRVNNIYRNKNNEAFMLIPLMPIGREFPIFEHYEAVRERGCYISYVAFLRCYNTEIQKIDHIDESVIKELFILRDFETEWIAKNINGLKLKTIVPVLLTPTNRGNIHIIDLEKWKRDQILTLFYMIVINDLPKTHPAYDHLRIDPGGLIWWIKHFKEIKIKVEEGS